MSSRTPSATPQIPVVGMLQAQVLKYVLRCWHKGNAEQDLQKSEWYLRRLIKAVSNV